MRKKKRNITRRSKRVSIAFFAKDHSEPYKQLTYEIDKEFLTILRHSRDRILYLLCMARRHCKDADAAILYVMLFNVLVDKGFQWQHIDLELINYIGGDVFTTQELDELTNILVDCKMIKHKREDKKDYYRLDRRFKFPV